MAETERTFLAEAEPEQKRFSRLSWGLEGALALGWALGLIQRLPEPTRTANDEELDAIFAALPALGDETEVFLSNLTYRDPGEVLEENLVNELATGYFRDLLFNGQPDATRINRMVSFERHKTLNWLRQFSGIADWDNIDTFT